VPWAEGPAEPVLVGAGRWICLANGGVDAWHDADVRHLLWLREQVGDDLLDAAVITAGDHALSATGRHCGHPRRIARSVTGLEDGHLLVLDRDPAATEGEPSHDISDPSPG
jgi:hypothetical protein